MRALREGVSHTVEIIDQTKLPFALAWLTLKTADEVARAIKTMEVRGAPLIGVAGAYGLALALKHDATKLVPAYETLKETRPTAVNLKWALDRVRDVVENLPPSQRFERAWSEASGIAAAESDACKRIGEAGLPLLLAARRGATLNVLTHCNAGWLATGDWGTALAPLYAAHAAGTALHVWVDETRPRNQGALTAWELADASDLPHAHRRQRRRPVDAARPGRRLHRRRRSHRGERRCLQQGGYVSEGAGARSSRARFRSMSRLPCRPSTRT